MNDVLMITLLLPYKIIFYKQTPMQKGFTVKKNTVQRHKNRFLLETLNKIHFSILSLLFVHYTLYNPFVVIIMACKM